MSQWEDQFRSHEVHNILDQVLSQAASSKEIAKDDSDALTHLSRLSEVLRLTRSRLASSDPDMSPIAPLSTLQQPLQEILNQLNNYVSNQNVAHLAKANNNVDQLIIILNTNYPPTSTLGTEQVAEIVSTLRGELARFSAASAEHLERLTERTEVLSTKTDNAVQELSAQRARLDEAINSFQQQFTQAEESRREQAQQTSDEYAEELEQIKTTRTEAFDELKKQVETYAIREPIPDRLPSRALGDRIVGIEDGRGQRVAGRSGSSMRQGRSAS